jgi:Xaa-Pro dipeptidase
MGKFINKDLKVDGKILVSEGDWNAELEGKYAKLSEWLRAQGLSAVLIRRSENVAWLTGGAVEMRVVIPAETSVGALLFTVDGKRYYLAPKNEGPRFHEEEFSALDYEPVLFPWYESSLLSEVNRLAQGTIGTDHPAEGFTPVDLAALRASLTEPEIARYRWLSQQTAISTAAVLEMLAPGITEFEMEARISGMLLAKGILPTVLLMGVDDRIYKFKHAVARGAVLQKYGMLNLCARRWGLIVSITRFVHFGSPSADLQERFAAAAAANAALLDATREGATAARLFSVAKESYAKSGFAKEEELHHQGGSTGYTGREWVATPAGEQKVVNNQAFAWNPSVKGGKVEDTILLRNGKIEVMTSTPSLPVVTTVVNGSEYRSAGLLVK